MVHDSFDSPYIPLMDGQGPERFDTFSLDLLLTEKAECLVECLDGVVGIDWPGVAAFAEFTAVGIRH